MVEKIQRAGAALDEVVSAYTDIFGEFRANDWFALVRDVLLEQAKLAGMIGEEEPEIDKEAHYKKMQDEAAAALEAYAAARDGIKPQVKDEESDEEEESETEEESEEEESETEEESKELVPPAEEGPKEATPKGKKK